MVYRVSEDHARTLTRRTAPGRQHSRCRPAEARRTGPHADRMMVYPLRSRYTCAILYARGKRDPAQTPETEQTIMSYEIALVLVGQYEIGEELNGYIITHFGGLRMAKGDELDELLRGTTNICGGNITSRTYVTGMPVTYAYGDAEAPLS